MLDPRQPVSDRPNTRETTMNRTDLAAMAARTATARTLIGSLTVGDPVIVGTDGTEYAMTVSRGPRLADGTHGDPNGIRVTVTLGPGRYSREVVADSVGAGYVTIRRA